MNSNQTQPSINPTKKRFPVLVGGIIIVFLVGLLIILGVQLKQSQVTSLSPGQVIRDFSVTSFDGDTYTLSELSGKVVLLNFWSSWCLSCDEEGAALEEVWQEIKDKGDIVFLGVNYVDTEKDSRAFLESYSISYPNGADLGSKIAQYFKVEAVPETYLIGKNGTLVAIQIGPFTTADDVRAFLEQALE